MDSIASLIDVLIRESGRNNEFDNRAQVEEARAALKAAIATEIARCPTYIQLDGVEEQAIAEHTAAKATIVALASGKWECTICHKPATCVGYGEGPEHMGLACDECCGHGNEDGWCVQLECVMLMSKTQEEGALRMREKAADIVDEPSIYVEDVDAKQERHYRAERIRALSLID